eukprot:UN03088
MNSEGSSRKGKGFKSWKEAQRTIFLFVTSRRERPMAADLTNFEIKDNCVILLLVWSHKMSTGWRPFPTIFLIP